MKRILETAELEHCSIRLAEPSELNDPMEGYQDVVWQGDAVLWANLLRHYLLTLSISVTDCLLTGALEPDVPEVDAMIGEDDLPTDDFRALYHEICEQFFLAAPIAALPEALASLRFGLRRHAVRFILSAVHVRALSCTMSTFHKHGLVIQDLAVSAETPSVGIAELVGLLQEADDEDAMALEAVAFSANQVGNDESLGRLLRLESTQPVETLLRKHFLFHEFPEKYVDGIVESLIHPAWHTACFAANCTNASMWASYADEHRGVALMFRPRTSPEGTPCIPVVGVTGVSSTPTLRTVTKGTLSGSLHKVRYVERAPEIQFFQFLARVPMGKLRKTWLTSPTGAQSSLIGQFAGDLKEWRKVLWGKFFEMATTKLDDWSHEEEYRFVFEDSFDLRRDERIVEYQLSDLAGVVLGMRSTVKDKLAVARTLLGKHGAKLPKDFGIYQMVYDARNRKLVRL